MSDQIWLSPMNGFQLDRITTKYKVQIEYLMKLSPLGLGTQWLSLINIDIPKLDFLTNFKSLRWIQFFSLTNASAIQIIQFSMIGICSWIDFKRLQFS